MAAENIQYYRPQEATYYPPVQNPVTQPVATYVSPASSTMRNFSNTQWALICRAELAGIEIKPLGFIDRIAFDQKDQNLVRYTAFWQLPDIIKIRGFLIAANKHYQDNLNADASFDNKDIGNLREASKLMNKVSMPSHTDERIYEFFKRAQFNALRHSSTEDLISAIQSNNHSFLQEEIGTMQEVLVNSVDPVKFLRLDIADLSMTILQAAKKIPTQGQRNILTKLQNLLMDYKKLALEGNATETIYRQQDEVRFFAEMNEKLADLAMEKYETEPVKKLGQLLHSIGMLYLMRATAHERTGQILFEAYEKKNRAAFARPDVILNEDVKCSEDAFTLAYQYYTLTTKILEQELNRAAFDEENIKHALFAKMSGEEKLSLQNRFPRNYWDYVGTDSQEMQKLITNKAKLQSQLEECMASVSFLGQHLSQRPHLSARTNEILANLPSHSIVTQTHAAPAFIQPPVANVIPRPEETVNNLRKLAETMICANRNADAMAMYEKILQLAPNSLQDLFNLAALARGSRDLYKAVDCYSKILTISPNDQQVYIELGNAYKEFQLFEEAIKNFNYAYSINPNNAIGQQALRALQNRM